MLRAISGSPGDLEPVFRAVLENATRLCAAKFGTLFLYEGGDAFRAVAMHNAPPAYSTRLNASRWSDHLRTRPLDVWRSPSKWLTSPISRRRGPTLSAIAMLQRAKDAGVEIMMLTVDSMTGGNRERDLRTGFSIPLRLTLAGMLQFAIKPLWGINYATHEPFRLPQLDEHVDMNGGALSIGRYFTEMLDPSMNWDDVAEMVRQWNGQFCLKGIMSAADAKRAAEIGCNGVVVSNHGGRQLDGSRASFDQLAEIVDAVGDRIDVLMDGGVQRGTHVLKALSVGAKAVGVGRYYLYSLAAAGQAGVERALGLMRTEIERDMKLMGCTAISQLSRSNLRFR